MWQGFRKIAQVVQCFETNGESTPIRLAQNLRLTSCHLAQLWAESRHDAPVPSVRFVTTVGPAMVGVMSLVELDSKLAPIADSLISRSNGAYDADFVRDLVAQIASEFEDVPVRDYIDVLIAKEAMDEMRRLKALNLVTS